MDNICNEDICTGCGACKAICPTNSIILKANEEGFIMPVINDMSCINCGKCKEMCPSNNSLNRNKAVFKVYAAQNMDTNVLKNSTSGGAFAALAIPILQSEGVVFGATMDTRFNVKHIKVSNEKELQLLHGSKYVQSNTANTYKEAEKELKAGKKVLYVGTPCQIAGLYAVLGNSHYDNLITADLVCHGVAPQALFRKYLDELGKKENSPVVNFQFRNKEQLSEQYNSKISFLNSKISYVDCIDNDYLSCYMQLAIYRESCYKCKYANIPRVADFTIGDYIGVDSKVVNKNIKQKGISVLLVNNETALKYFEEIKRYLKLWERPLEEATSTNLCLIQPSKRPEIRDFIFADKELSVHELRSKYCKVKLRHKDATYLGYDRTLKVIKLVQNAKNFFVKR